jgi:hypothetical protein
VIELVLSVPTSSYYAVKAPCEGEGSLVVGEPYPVIKIISSDEVPPGSGQCIYTVEVTELIEGVWVTTTYTFEDVCGDWVVGDPYSGDAVLTTYHYDVLSVASESFDGGYFCQNPDSKHPAAQALADEYDVSYQTVMRWFCKPGEDAEGKNNANTGLGNIKLALQTAEFTGATADEYLAARDDKQGWGTIWDDLCYHGKPKEGKDPYCELEPAGEPGAETLGAADESDKQTGPPDHAQNKKPKKNK